MPTSHSNNKKTHHHLDQLPVTRGKLEDLQSFKEVIPTVLIAIITIYQKILSHKVILMYL